MENLVSQNFNNFYKGKKVLITGHTGFKGSWLSIWLNLLGAEVIGYSLDPKHEADNFNRTKIGSLIKDYRGDINHINQIQKVFDDEQPEIVFHLAAQALVLDGYNDPVLTYQTNIMGTVNILECIRASKSVKQGIFITTDKVYDNKEWIWPYRENEPLGGYDPYSASKGASEIVIASYRDSFFNPNNYDQHGVSISTTRAGNVIGGGDWSENRIVPDCIKSLLANEPIQVRNPNAIRPWQHVLEPLGGYLLLGYWMDKKPLSFNEAWNFGPENSNIVTVQTLVEEIIENYSSGKWVDLSDKNALHEANFLSLDINKAKSRLDWKPNLSFKETVKLTLDWYKNDELTNMYEFCIQQINFYINK